MYFCTGGVHRGYSPITEKDIEIALEKLKSPSATWTYIINDNPMGFALGVVGDIGSSTAMGIVAPIIILFSKLREKWKNIFPDKL